jgi:hypothetical protein
MIRKTTLALILAFCMGGLTGATWLVLPRSSHGELLAPLSSAWTEVEWPFPIDEWGRGKAFRCPADHCGTQVELYIRPKIGFCNCSTGVSDDDELSRLSDFHLMGSNPSVLRPGRPISVAWMKGRSQAYAVLGPLRATRSALTIAFNDHCDAIVATVVLAHDQPETIEPSVVEFLNSNRILKWAEVSLGL